MIACALCVIAATMHAEPAVGTQAPEFSLPDTEGETVTLKEQKGKYVVLEWTNPGCPFVKKHYTTDNMQTLQKTYTEKGVVWLTVCSSAPGKQGHYNAEAWNKILKENGSNETAMLLDPDGTVGRAYGAKATPHMFVIDPEGKLIYKGAIDDNRSWDPATVRTAKNYVKAALDAAMEGGRVETTETQAYGCSVKY
jgi:peroxiredoxin